MRKLSLHTRSEKAGKAVLECGNGNGSFVPQLGHSLIFRHRPLPHKAVLGGGFFENFGVNIG